MSKQKKTYDAAKLYLQGLIAFGNFFHGLHWTKTHLTKAQHRRRRAFKAQQIARRLQRQAAT